MRIAVVGAGVIGLSAVAALLRRGADVVCFERTGRGMTERSAGSSRIFRLAHGDPDLVARARIARQGFERWRRPGAEPLISPVGCVVSGTGVAEWAAAMAAAGAAHELVEPQRLRLPVRTAPEPALLDPAGGVIDVDAVRTLLAGLSAPAVIPALVSGLDPGPGGVRVISSAGRDSFDAVLLAAGAGTAPLAAQVGLSTPSTLAHHVRFSFPVQVGDWPCWIDKPAGEPGTYQHQSGPGRWSLGGFVDPELTTWERGRDAAAQASRAAALRYAAERLIVQPRIVDSLYCTHVPDLGDGYVLQRSGSVVAIHGENLFKFAPLIGEELAAELLVR